MKTSIVWLLALPLVAFAGDSRSAPLRLDLRDRYEATGSDLRLGDIVAAGSDAPEGLLSLPLGSPPSLGKERLWSRESISALLHSRFETLSIEWEGSFGCRVSRPARTCELDELRERLLAALKKLTASTGTAEILELAGAEPFLAPSGPVETTIEFAPSTLSNPWSTAILRYHSRGDTVLVKSVRFHWSWRRNVWQAIRTLAGGGAMEPGDFKSAPADVLRLEPDIYQGDEIPSECRLAQTITAGTILRARHYKPTILVKKGTLVTARYFNAGLHILLKAVAMEDGVRGAAITLQNSVSRKPFVARVMDEGAVEYVH